MAKAVIGALRVVLGLDSAEFEAGMRRAGKTTSTFSRQTMSMASVVKGATAALGGISALQAARTYLDLADKSAKLTAQLRLATQETGSFAQAQADVQRIAASSTAGISEVADLYAVLMRNSIEVGISQQEAARHTETITKAFKVSGATASEAAGALRQFLQGIQSGVLRGEELNSILEQGPRLARALADGLDVGVGSLKAMGEAGELTADKVLGAIASSADQIDAEFAQLPTTFQDAMTMIENAATITFGAFDEGGGFSQALAQFILSGTGGFEDLAGSASDLGMSMRADFAGLYDAFQPLLSGAMTAFGQIDDRAAESSQNVRGLLALLDSTTRMLTDPLNMEAMFGIENKNKSRFLERYDQGRAESLSSRGRAKQEREFREQMKGRDIWGNLTKPTARPRPAAGGKSGGGGGGKGKDPEREAERLRKEQERETKRAADALRRFTDDLESRNADIQTNMAELSRSIEARATAEINQINVRKLSEERSIQADENLDEAKKKELIALNEKEAQTRIALVNQRLADEQAQREVQIIQDRNDLAIEMYGYTKDLARTASQAREVELRILGLSFETEKARLEQIKATNAATSAEYKYAEARLAALPNIQKAATQQVERQTQGPLEAYLDKLPRSADEAREALERVQVDGIEGIVDGLAQAATGAKSLGDVFKGVANQIIQDLIRIQIQKAIVGGISKAIGSFGGGFGSIATPGIGDLSGSIGGSSKLHDIPGFSTGGSFEVGGSSAVGDKNLFAFRANKGEMVNIRKGNDNGGGGIATIVPSPYFDVAVDGRIVSAAPAIADAGANVGVARMGYGNSRRVG